MAVEKEKTRFTAATVLENRPVAKDVYWLRLAHTPAACGQFYMLRPLPGALDPLLGRPLSVAEPGENAAFLYRVQGKGTALLAARRVGDTVEAFGPLGNGFPLEDSDLAVVGGGLGIAPLYGLLQAHAAAFPARKRHAWLGFSDAPFWTEGFAALATLETDVGGYITDKADWALPALYCACGPTPMLRAAKAQAAATGARLYLSLEARMACGVGACLGCSCATIAGNRRVCKDGPVFPAEEVLL